MTTEQLNFFGAWASIISLLVSLVSLCLIGSVKWNVIRYRRKQRLQRLIHELLELSDDSEFVPETIRYKLNTLGRIIPAFPWSHWTAKGRTALELRKQLAQENLLAVKEALEDWRSFSEDL